VYARTAQNGMNVITVKDGYGGEGLAIVRQL
jgi:hypothetical protein